MEIVWIIIGVVAAAWLVFAWLKKLPPFGSGSTTPTHATGQQQIINSLVHTTVRPGMPKILSRTPLSEDVLQGIIDGFTERIAAARAKGWASGLDPELYTLYVFPSVRDVDAGGNYSPVFQVFLDASDPYIGSEYDHGGWIYAAEQVLTTGNVPKNEFIIAENNSREYTANAVANGLDHLFAWHNDRNLYAATKDHSSGGGHPLW